MASQTAIALGLGKFDKLSQQEVEKLTTRNWLGNVIFVDYPAGMSWQQKHWWCHKYSPHSLQVDCCDWAFPNRCMCNVTCVCTREQKMATREAHGEYYGTAYCRHPCCS